MKLRRLMQMPVEDKSLPKGGVVRHSKIGRSMTAVGQTRQIGALATLAACPLCLQQRPN
jgi:hypothetical protein